MRGSIVCVLTPRKSKKEKALKKTVKENIKANRNASQCNPHFFGIFLGFFLVLQPFFFSNKDEDDIKTTSIIRSAV